MPEAPLPEDPNPASGPVRRLFGAYRKRVEADDRNLVRRLERALTVVGIGQGEKGGTNGDLPGGR